MGKGKVIAVLGIIVLLLVPGACAVGCTPSCGTLEIPGPEFADLSAVNRWDGEREPECGTASHSQEPSESAIISSPETEDEGDSSGESPDGDGVTGIVEDVLVFVEDTVKEIIKQVQDAISGIIQSPDVSDESAQTNAVDDGNIANAIWPLVAALGIGAGLAYAVISKMAFAAMHTKITNDDVLKNETRSRIYDIIKSHPGICVNEISGKAGVGWSSVIYHISVLAGKNMIVTSFRGKKKHVFENGNAYRKDEKQRIMATSNDTAAAILRFIESNPGSTQKEMTAALGFSSSLTSWHTANLESTGLIQKERDGKTSRHYASFTRST